MEDFLYGLNDFIGVDNYFVFFENPDVENTGPSIVAEIVFGLTYLKLIDGALKYSKKEVLDKYYANKNLDNLDEILMETAIYPSGETLGFYNTSDYDIEKLCNLKYEKQCSKMLAEYIACFSDNIKKVFDELSFDIALKYLDETRMTLKTLKQFNDTAIKGDIYSSYDKFMYKFTDFIKSIWSDEIYSHVRDPISNYDVFSSYNYIHEAVEEYGSFLNSLLLMDKDFKNNDSVNIFDPDSSGTYILKETKRQIEQIKRDSGHDDSNVKIYGKAKKTENKMIYLAKKSVSKKDPYEIENATILSTTEDILSLDEIERYEDFNLIVSNYLYNNLTEYKDILNIFKKSSDYNTKLVISLNNLDDFIDDLKEIIAHDNLEALISFKNHYIVIANLNKNYEKNGKFLLIDGSDSELNDSQIDRENKEAFSNNSYDFFNVPYWKTLAESDRNKMKAIMESYRFFEETINSIIILNDEYDEEMIKILLN